MQLAHTRRPALTAAQAPDGTFSTMWTRGVSQTIAKIGPRAPRPSSTASPDIAGSPHGHLGEVDLFLLRRGLKHGTHTGAVTLSLSFSARTQAPVVNCHIMIRRGHATDVVSDLELIRHSWMQTHNYVSGLVGLEGLGC